MSDVFLLKKPNLGDNKLHYYLTTKKPNQKYSDPLAHNWPSYRKVPVFWG
jgi:hypothetical protein